MILKNGSVFVDEHFCKADVKIENGYVCEISENIAESGDVIDCKSRLIIPGLIDVHTHGSNGIDFNTASSEEMEKLCEIYAKSGVTSIVATTMTAPKNVLINALRTIANATNENGAKIEGINLEGPFLSSVKRGAHSEKHLMKPSSELLSELSDASLNKIKIVNIAPELEGAMDFIEQNKNKYVMSLAHTDCDYQIGIAAVEHGARHITHMFNAMRSPHHREPALLGVALEKNIYCEVIADMFHVHPSFVRLLFSAVPEKTVLISDSIPPKDMANGEYEFGGQTVIMQNGKIMNNQGTLAGSSITVFDAMKNVINLGIAPEKAILSATLNAAKSVGIENHAGKIAVGRSADILVLSQNYDLKTVFINGKKI